MPFGQACGVGDEVTWATPVTRTKFAKVMEGSFLNHMADRVKSAKLSSNVGADPEGNFDKGQRGEGKIIVPMSFDDGLGLKMMKHLIGTVATTGAGPFIHTFTRSVLPAGGASPTSPSLTVELNYELPDTNLQSRILAGARVRQGTFSFNAGEEIVLDMDIIGKEVTQVVKSASPTFPDYETYEMKFPQANLTVNAVAYGLVCSGLDFTVNNGHEPRIRLGSVFTQQPVRRGVAELSGTLKIDWELVPSGKNLWDAFKANAPQPIVVTITGPSGTSFVITIAKCFFNEGSLLPEEGQLQSAEFPFLAYHDATNTAVKIVATSPVTTV